MIKIKTFKLTDLAKDDVKLKILRLIDEEWREEDIEYEGDLQNVISSYAHNLAYSKLKKLGKGYYVEVEITAPGYSAAEGVGEFDSTYPLLFPRPARLCRIGIISKNNNVGKEDGISLENIKWIDFTIDEVYVYEGLIEVAGEWQSIIIETDQGTRVITPNEVVQVAIKPKIKVKKVKKKRKKRKRRKRKRSRKK